MNNIVIFDLDGTLLSNDSTKTWLKTRLKSNPIRLLMAIVCSPIILPLLKYTKYKAFGTSLFFWIATYGLSENELQDSFKNFSEQVKNHYLLQLYWFRDGLLTLESQIAQKREVIIVTAAPELLAQELISSMGFDIKVIGTPLKRKRKGWVADGHCRHQEKVNRLNKIGISGPWLATYTDHFKDDYPILSHCLYPYLINAKSLKQSQYLMKNLQYLDWN